MALTKSARAQVAARKRKANSSQRPRYSFGKGDLKAVNPRLVGLSATPIQQYETAMHELSKKKVIPGCASVVLHKGQVIQAGCFGYADVERKVPFAMDSLCRLYCMTKTYVSIAFGTLVDEGRLRFDDRLDKYLPEFKNHRCLVKEEGTSTEPAKCPLRMYHLMAHTSGVDYAPDLGEECETKQMEDYLALQTAVEKRKIKTLKEFVRQMAKLPTSFQPGKTYRYSWSMDVMSRVLEVVEGKSIEKILLERVFNPLHMKDTLWAVPDRLLPRLAACYAFKRTASKLYPKKKAGSGLCRIDGSTPKESAWRVGRACPVLSGGGFMGYLDGGLVSTVADTAMFLQMLANKGITPDGKRLISEKTLAVLEKNRLKAAWGSGKANYMGNIGVFREGGSEIGMGGAACTYWSLDRKEDMATVWFTQHVDMPDFTEDLKGVNKSHADLWSLLHKTYIKAKGAKRKVTSAASSRSAKKQKKA
eukprot:TRINITY_DN13654_c0_g1_i1.p1 TRINITY_DN13654_c0_g1~~TRINITY_DN13654_c0_g1_i1.p1  ORF type:complete len:475 (-),score=131.10 TRINITY_DN13654_c0_g1_i1:574-1998(-)